MEGDKVTMVEMEDALANDAGGLYRSELLERLDSHRAALKKEMDAGLAPKDFEKANAVMEAIGVASNVIDNVWKSNGNS